jgi:uncharacterized protein YbjT (DUF2867 family)
MYASDLWLVGYQGWGDHTETAVIVAESSDAAVRGFLVKVEDGEIDGVYELTGDDILVYRLQANPIRYTTGKTYVRAP